MRGGKNKTQVVNAMYIQLCSTNVRLHWPCFSKGQCSLFPAANCKTNNLSPPHILDTEQRSWLYRSAVIKFSRTSVSLLALKSACKQLPPMPTDNRDPGLWDRASQWAQSSCRVQGQVLQCLRGRWGRKKEEPPCCASARGFSLPCTSLEPSRNPVSMFAVHSIALQHSSSLQMFADLLQYWKGIKQHSPNKNKATKAATATEANWLKTNKQKGKAFIFIAACLISFIYLGIQFACSRHNKHCKLLLIQALPPVPNDGLTDRYAIPLVFCWESQTHTTSALVLPCWPSKETRYTSILGHKDLCTSPTDSKQQWKKTQREMKKKNVARKAAGLELQEPNWDCICKQQKQPEMQESCPGALGSDVATNHTWRRALRLSCLLAATAGPAQPPAWLTSTACML